MRFSISFAQIWFSFWEICWICNCEAAFGNSLYSCHRFPIPSPSLNDFIPRNFFNRSEPFDLFLCYPLFPGFSSSAERNYYEILGVPENASRDEIKKAFHSVRTFFNSWNAISNNFQLIFGICNVHISYIVCQNWAFTQITSRS